MSGRDGRKTNNMSPSRPRSPRDNAVGRAQHTLSDVAHRRIIYVPTPWMSSLRYESTILETFAQLDVTVTKVATRGQEANYSPRVLEMHSNTKKIGSIFPSSYIERDVFNTPLEGPAHGSHVSLVLPSSRRPPHTALLTWEPLVLPTHLPNITKYLAHCSCESHQRKEASRIKFSAASCFTRIITIKYGLFYSQNPTSKTCCKRPSFGRGAPIPIRPVAKNCYPPALHYFVPMPASAAVVRYLSRPRTERLSRTRHARPSLPVGENHMRRELLPFISSPLILAFPECIHPSLPMNPTAVALHPTRAVQRP
ncbi:hypothetical protein ACRALDRAFT_210482 [Sodiomyces alcalophilus JCM 7366]|uniref:uncharacterized protein n=1 Tax=Sodiomyces alcalophilus JCM 7366 TaxID=591952 RepID=UPI0039B59200